MYYKTVQKLHAFCLDGLYWILACFLVTNPNITGEIGIQIRGKNLCLGKIFFPRLELIALPFLTHFSSLNSKCVRS